MAMSRVCVTTPLASTTSLYGQKSSQGGSDVWPELPIAIRVLYYGRLRPRTQALVTNVIAALEQHDRVCEIRLEGGPNLLSYDARELSGRPVSAYPWERKQG